MLPPLVTGAVMALRVTSSFVVNLLPRRLCAVLSAFSLVVCRIMARLLYRASRYLFLCGLLYKH